MDKRLQKIINYFREDAGFAGAPTNNASSGIIAGLPPDQPPVRKKKKKYIYGRGYRKLWQTR